MRAWQQASNKCAEEENFKSSTCAVVHRGPDARQLTRPQDSFFNFFENNGGYGILAPGHHNPPPPTTFHSHSLPFKLPISVSHSSVRHPLAIRSRALARSCHRARSCATYPGCTTPCPGCPRGQQGCSTPGSAARATCGRGSSGRQVRFRSAHAAVHEQGGTRSARFGAPTARSPGRADQSVMSKT